MTGEEAVALLRRGEAAHDDGRLGEAAEAFEALIAAGALADWAWFFLGRVRRDQGDPRGATAAFDAALALTPGLFWAHHERLAVAHRRGDAPERLAALADGMLAVDWEKLEPGHVKALEPVAHALWDGGFAGQAAALFGRLWPSDALGGLALVRLVERAADPEVVRAAARRLQAMGALDATALRVLAEHHGRAGEDGEELRALERRWRLAPDEFEGWLALARAYARAGDRERLAGVWASRGAFTPQRRSLARLIVDLELGEAEAAFLGFRTLARLWAEVPKHPGIRLAYMLGDRFETARRDEVLALLRWRHGDDPEVALVELNAAMRDQRWDDARALFERRFADMPDKPEPVRLAQADVLAFGGRLEEAAALLDAERVEGALPPAFVRPALRVLAELGRWEEAFEAGLPHLGADASFQHFLSPMVRAARRCGRTAELFDLLAALPRPLAPDQADALFALAEDLAEAGERDVAARLADLSPTPERLRRIALKLQGDAPPAPGAKDLCVYYCADRAYLTPALVSLASLATLNPGVARRADFRLVVDADAADEARAGARGLAERLGVDLEVVDASAVVASADRLRTAYGMVTGGQSLALAAYYRIFYARHLLTAGSHARALYVDADTLVRDGLDELLDAPMDAPLLARPEVDRPEVRRAAALHGLARPYFNSGVLLFDLRHPVLPDALDRAAAAALDPDAPLVFQDQCALNIGFDGLAGELPERFNHFAPPDLAGEEAGAGDAVVVHFLDRPKPWDGLYRRPAREWFGWYGLVRAARAGLAPGRADGAKRADPEEETS